MIEKLTEFCKNNGLSFLVEYDGDKLLRFMFVSNNEDNDYELLGARGKYRRHYKPQRRYCQDFFVEGYLKSEDKESLVDLLIDGVKAAFQID